MTDWVQLGTGALEDAAKGAAAGSIVPGLGTVAGGLIGLAASLAGHMLPASAKPALSAAAKAITGASDEAGQVAAINSDSAMADTFRVQALQIQADAEAARDQALNDRITAALADVADARKQTIALAASGSSIAWGAPVISVIVLVSFGVMASLVLVYGVPTGAETVASVLLGYVGAMATATVSYWVGSSKGSSDKANVIATMIKPP